MSKKAETVIQKGILDALLGLGLIAVRLNSGSVRVKRGYLHLAPKGTPDLVVQLRDGRVGWVEVKTDEGKRTPEQAAFEVRARRDPCVYVLARSVNEALGGLGLIQNKGEEG